jgi:hypothetical protein
VVVVFILLLVILIYIIKDKEDGQNQSGNIIKIVTAKSRLTKEGKKTLTRIDFAKGLDRYYGLVDFAIEAGIFKKISTKIELPNGNTVFRKKIEKEPEKYFTKEILDEIENG